MSLESGSLKSPINNEKIALLRAEISRAEKREDNEEVMILEAELRAAEKGEIFDREKFIEESKRKNKKTKHKVLREMQGLSSVVKNPTKDRWFWDATESRDTGVFPYENSFASILNQLNITSFQELVSDRSRELKRKIQVLDLFGGAYFLADLRNISKIIGVRLKNIDELLINESMHGAGLDKLIDDPRRIVLEGDLYKSDIWRMLKNEKDHGFDLIICRPGGPFGETYNSTSINDVKDTNMVKEEIFIVLMDRALKLLSPDGGMLFSQIPKLDTEQSISDKFWEKYVEDKTKEGYEFIFGTFGNTKKTFAVSYKG